MAAVFLFSDSMSSFPMKVKGLIRAGIPGRKKTDSPKIGLLNKESKKFYRLNDIALFVWDNCDGSHSVKDISRILLNEVKKSSHPSAKTASLSDIEKDVGFIIERLRKFGLVK